MKSNHLKEPAKYLDAIGIKPFRDQGKFWSYMERRHGAPKCETIDAAMEQARQGSTIGIYEQMYQNLDLSLDVASTRRNLYFHFLEWFIGTIRNFEGTLLDIGCGNGVHSCFYAIRYPAATVVGIDVSNEAISCAKQLAERLELKNVEFKVADYNSEALPLGEKSIDLAVSLTGLDPECAGTRDVDLLKWVDSLSCVFA